MSHLGFKSLLPLVWVLTLEKFQDRCRVGVNWNSERSLSTSFLKQGGRMNVNIIVRQVGVAYV
jgi:hypothetical protein